MSTSKFQKGKSGNSAGRPKGSRNWGTLIDEELNKPVTIRENGKTKKIPMAEFIMKNLVRKGMNGDLSAAAIVLNHSSGPDSEEHPVFCLRMGKDLSPKKE